MSIGIDFYRLGIVLKTEIGIKNKIYRVLWISTQPGPSGGPSQVP
jgi:hypothetical protein